MDMKLFLSMLTMLALAPASISAESSRVPYPPGYRPPARPQPAPAFTPCIDYSYLQALMGPCQGPIGGTIRVRLRQNLNSVPAMLSFKAVVSRGVPARVHVRLQRQGSDYVLAAPPQLCTQGGGSWETELILANGQNLGVIGGYTPTNCAR